MSDEAINFDADIGDDERRTRLYAGELFVYSPTPSSKRFVELAAGLCAEAFGPLDPQTAQFHLPVERYAAILGELKPRFIHHPESQRLLAGVLAELGCALEQTYFDVPRMRSSTSDSYLTTGIAYAWHPHRDTWYSAPASQLNWWTPIYPIESRNAMAFHPRYFNRPVKNTSRAYNYYLWNQQHRGAHVAQYVKEDPRPLPRASEPLELEPQIRLLVPPGALILFSGAQLHSSVPNTSGKTRFSIDFRTVHRGDAAAGRGAARCDEECTGTTMRDYRRATDLTPMPEEIIALYSDGTEQAGSLVYQPDAG